MMSDVNIMGGGTSMLSSIFGVASTPSLHEWSELNTDLMDRIYRMYLNSGMLGMITKRLSEEVLRGGVCVREVLGSADRGEHSNAEAGTVRITVAEKNHIEAMLNRAIVYGHLYGLVPVMNVNTVKSSDSGGECGQDVGEQHHSAYSGQVGVAGIGESLRSLEIPLPNSGGFVARTDKIGRVQLGWQWRDNRRGNRACRPTKGVWVFVWKDQMPIVGTESPFNSTINTVFNDLMRIHDMVKMDTQAYYEMTHPSLMMQEHPRSGRDTADRQVYEFATEHFVVDPEGDDMMGHGPGGTVVGKQHMLASEDYGAQSRANRSVQSAANSQRRSVQCRIDPVTGRFYTEDHTTIYERGFFRAPSGMTVISSYPRPTLRSDLLQTIEHTYRHVANTFGVPPIFINSGSTDVSGVHKTSSVGGSNSALANNSLMQTDASSENMRKTVVAVRNELSAMFAQAHHNLIWNTERIAMSEQLARSESAVRDMDQECDQTMERQLELLGDRLAQAYRDQRLAQIRDSGELMRAAQIADQASKLFRGERLRRRIDSILGIVAGVTDGSLGFPGDMTLEGEADRQRRGEGMIPEDDEGVLRDPDDIQGDLTHPPKRVRDAEKKGKKNKKGRAGGGEFESDIDPNELSEWPEDRRDRIASEGRGVDDYTTIPAGPYTYQRRSLTEKPASITEAIDKATEIVDRRMEIVEETKRLDRMRAKLTPSTGRRGDTKIELVFRSLPVPNWPMLRGMVLDGILGADRYKEMVMTDLGLDPKRDGPPPSIKPLAVAMQSLKNDAKSSAGKGTAKPKQKASAEDGDEQNRDAEKKRKREKGPETAGMEKEDGGDRGSEEKEKPRGTDDKDDANKGGRDARSNKKQKKK